MESGKELTVLEISHGTMVFMRGKYRLDEIGDGKDELKFKQGKKTIASIIHDNYRSLTRRINFHVLGS